VIESDILSLSSQIVYFSAWVNHLSTLAATSKSTRDDAYLRATLEVRNWAESQEISIRALGADVVKGLASAAVQKEADWETTVTTVAETVKGFYFALKDFVQYLARVSQRHHGERYITRRE